jgi:hypothetical protein
VDLIIDPKTINIDFKIVDLSIYIIFVKKYSTSKAIRVFNNLIRNIVIGLNKGTNFVIIIIESIEEYMLLKNPLV